MMLVYSNFTCSIFLQGTLICGSAIVGLGQLFWFNGCLKQSSASEVALASISMGKSKLLYLLTLTFYKWSTSLCRRRIRSFNFIANILLADLILKKTSTAVQYIRVSAV